LGLEPSYKLYIDHLVMVFREIRRVLKPQATAWLNLGDSFSGSWGNYGGQNRGNGSQRDIITGSQFDQKSYADLTQWKPPTANKNDGLKNKDLCLIPHRTAIALQESGWWVRGDIVWAKPSPMPESVEDRPTRSHEYIFLLAKNETYYYDHEAIKEPAICGHPSGNGYKRDSRLTYADSNGARGSDKQWKPRPSAPKGSFAGKTEQMAGTGQNAFRAVTEMRNKRDVWTVGSEPFPDAHFATFPPDLILPCILAGCPVGGTVLDPFSGAATTALVAKENGRKCIGIELNEEYLKMSVKRLRQDVFDFTESEAL
jgi:DNA modification methylase